MKRFLSFAAVLFSSTALFWGTALYATGVVEYRDGLETARETGYLSRFVAGLELSGLDATVSQAGPYTILAPTDAAFSQLPEGLSDILFRRPSALREVLLYHIVPGTIRERQFGADPDMKARLATVGLVAVNVDTTNGVMHVVDTVLIPESVDVAKLLLPDLIDILQADGRFSTLSDAIIAADLLDTLRGDGPFTLFAPTDDAFDGLLAESVTTAFGETAAIRDMVLRHIVPGQMMATDVASKTNVTSIRGDPISVQVDMGSIYVGRAQVVITDVQAGNGVIHVIDGVILPPESDEGGDR